MAREYVPIFFDWLDNTQDLNAEEKGHLIDAVILYASGSDEWIDSLYTSGEKIAFRFMRGQIDRNIEISKARAKAGASKAEQNETNENKTEQNETKLPKEKEKEKENKKESNKRFTPPTLQEVTQYCKERNNNVDPQQFIAFYTSKGWKVGNQPMKDWKACVLTWERRNGNSNSKNVTAQEYPQRDYENVQDQVNEELRKRVLERMRATS